MTTLSNPKLLQAMNTLIKQYGFTDVSWGNDTMASVLHEGNRLKVWIDYDLQENREYEGYPQFAVVATDEWGDSDTLDDIYSSDSLADVVKFIKNYKA